MSLSNNTQSLQNLLTQAENMADKESNISFIETCNLTCHLGGGRLWASVVLSDNTISFEEIIEDSIITVPKNSFVFCSQIEDDSGSDTIEWIKDTTDHYSFCRILTDARISLSL